MLFFSPYVVASRVVHFYAHIYAPLICTLRFAMAERTTESNMSDEGSERINPQLTSDEEERVSRWINQRRAENLRLRRVDPSGYHARLLDRMPRNRCCFCRCAFRGHGSNPQPVLDEGVACDECNATIVIPQRFRDADRVPK